MSSSKTKFGFRIPFALPVLEVTLGSLRDSLEFWESVFPRLFAKLVSKQKINEGKPVKLSMLITKIIIFLKELRRYGVFEFVHVDNGESIVSIRLW